MSVSYFNAETVKDTLALLVEFQPCLFNINMPLLVMAFISLLVFPADEICLHNSDGEGGSVMPYL